MKGIAVLKRMMALVMAVAAVIWVQPVSAGMTPPGSVAAEDQVGVKMGVVDARIGIEMTEVRHVGRMTTIVPQLKGQYGTWVRSATSSALTTADAPTEVWVDDSWEGTTPGTTVGGHTFGTDAFATIQEGIDAVAANGIVNVFPGDYDETASNRYVLGTQGPYQFGLFIGIDKGGITVRGVNSGGTPVTSYSTVEASVQCNATNSFGASGMFIEADNVLVSGLNIYQNPALEQNKSVEVIGDALTFRYNRITDGNSLYLNDWRFDTETNTSWLKGYLIDGNEFTNGTSVDICSGAGFSGPVSGRSITNNAYEMAGATWNGVSFNGSGTGVPWFVYSVGGATITGNTFSKGAVQYIRARGDYDNAQFDWQSYFQDNTFDHSVVIVQGSDWTNSVRTYSYTDTYTFSNCRRIGATIQGEIDHAVAGDEILIGPGHYAENVIINKTLLIQGSGELQTTVYPAVSDIGSDGAPSFGNSQVMVVSANDVTITALTVDGDNPLLSGGINRNGANINARNGIIESDGPWNRLTVHHATVKNIYLRGIYARSGGAGFNIHHNTVSNVGGGTQSIAIMAWMASGTIENNNVTLANDAIAANHSRGISFLNNTVTNSSSGVHTDNNNSQGGGTADLLEGNNVSNSTANGYGVWVFFPNGVSPIVRNNVVTNVDVGLFAWGMGSAAGTALFSGNRVDGEHRSNSVGAYVTTGLNATAWPYRASVAAVFTGNTLVNNSNGMAVEAESGYSADLHGWRNAIYGNTDGFWKQGAGTIATSMPSCYWGDISGPYNASTNADGVGNSIADNVDYSPWWRYDYLATPALPWEWGVNISNSSTLVEALDTANSGDFIKMAAETFPEGPQVVIAKNIRIEGTTGVLSSTTIVPTTSTGSSGDAKGWFLIQPAASVDLSEVTFDGSGFGIYQAVRCYGRAQITGSHFKNIAYGGGSYQGVGVVAFGTEPVIVASCTFNNIGRVGALFFGSGMNGVFSGSRYAGKGVGDWLDYAVEVGGGARATIQNCHISDCKGVASVDGSTSAGILVTTYFGTGTTASLINNDIRKCTSGLNVGYDNSDASHVTVTGGNLFLGNDVGITTQASSAELLQVYGNSFTNTVNAEDNTGNSTWDDGAAIGNCWSDWGTHGYPGGYHVAGSAGAVDHYPNKACGASCCVGVTGNVDLVGIVDLTDLSALVNYLTGGGYILACPAEANVDGTGIVDLVDLSALVNYLTGGGYVLPPCPAL